MNRSAGDDRAMIRLVRETSRIALVSSGPDAGTDVVTTGVQELYGVEEQVGH